MKFLTLTLLVILCASTSAYRVRKEPLSPSRGVILPQVNGLTTNYNEMVNDQSKKMVTMGIPEHVDLNHNIAIGDSYEDVEYVHSSVANKKSTFYFSYSLFFIF